MLLVYGSKVKDHSIETDKNQEVAYNEAVRRSREEEEVRREFEAWILAVKNGKEERMRDDAVLRSKHEAEAEE